MTVYRWYNWFICRLSGGHWWLLNLQFGTKHCLICHRLANSYAPTDCPDTLY